MIFQLSAIPAFGPTGRLTSYLGSYKFLTNTCGVVNDQIAKHQGEMFRVPFIDHWEVVVTGKKLINELAQAHDDDLSVIDAVADVLQTEFTMGASIKYDQYHVGVIGSTMTRNLVARFDDVYDEIASACEDVIQERAKGESGEWISVPAFDAVINVIARTGNRLFVGLPLCRNSEYLRLSRNWAIDVFIGAFFINFMPWLLKPLRQRIVDFRRRHFKHPGKDELKKTVTERVLLDREFGVDRPDRPNDAISWFYDAASLRYSPEEVVDEIVQRLMFLNFSAIHTSTHALTNVLYHLAEHPEIYLQPLRKEVEDVIARLGWTKAALRDMVKVDSFVRESERFNGLSSYHYMSANTFDGFRFSDIRAAAEGFDAIRHQFVHTTPDYVTFGHGRHSCPAPYSTSDAICETGRFFAANELKVALAHIVLFYDLKLGDECKGVKPANSWLSIALIPDKRAHIWFRKRKEVEIDL
ncbi:hypothetical protein DXG01_001709 [Tephrocybe rancida]|nr:hypothetical protein DXG01_001709 [Tephrocybe rancida]